VYVTRAGDRVGDRTARLLPPYLAGRSDGPLFLSSLAPVPSRQSAAADAEPRTGRARSSYRRAAEVFRTASGGWTLHQLRHSRLNHLAEAGVPGPLLMAKSRHGSVKTLNLYAKPTFDAVAEVTASLDPGRRRGAPR
jgi:integrase